MTSSPLPGFYPDPAGSGRERWWDGSAWTDILRDHVPVGAQPKGPVDPSSMQGQLNQFLGLDPTQPTQVAKPVKGSLSAGSLNALITAMFLIIGVVLFGRPTLAWLTGTLTGQHPDMPVVPFHGVNLPMPFVLAMGIVVFGLPAYRTAQRTWTRWRDSRSVSD